jgi:2-phosphoglycerate kinase
MNRETDEQRDRQTERQMNSETDEQTDMTDDCLDRWTDSLNYDIEMVAKVKERESNIINVILSAAGVGKTLVNNLKTPVAYHINIFTLVNE